MDIKDVQLKIQEELKEFASKYSFSFTSSENSLSQANGRLYKKDNNVSFTYGYGIVDNVVGNSSPRICFHNVEDITLPILIKNNLIGESSMVDPITFTPPTKELANKLKIETEGDLFIFLDKFKNNFKKIVLPVFKEFDSLKKVSAFLENVPQKEVINYFPKGIYKKATIWKLSGNPKYDEYINWLYNGMSNRANKTPENSDYTNSFNAVSDLKSVLDNL